MYLQLHVGCNTVSLGIDSEEGNGIKEEALKLISDGLEKKLIYVLQDLLSSNPPEEMVCSSPGTVIYGSYVIVLTLLV